MTQPDGNFKWQVENPVGNVNFDPTSENVDFSPKIDCSRKMSGTTQLDGNFKRQVENPVGNVDFDPTSENVDFSPKIDCSQKCRGRPN